MLTSRALRIVFLALLVATTIIGCGTQPLVPTQDTSSLSAEDRLNELYELAKRSRRPESERYQIEAAQVLMELNQLADATNLLDGINVQQLPQELRVQHLLALADLALYKFEEQQVLQILSPNRPEIVAAESDAKSRIRIGQLRAQAYQLTGNDFAGAQELIAIAGLMPAERAEINKEQIWRGLKRIPDAELTQIASNSQDSDLLGWLSLVALSNANQDDLDRQLRALSEWLQFWPEHYAAQNLPNELALLSAMVTDRPKNVSLLLPLSGKNEVAGKAILNGFLTAYYAARERGSYTPELQILDTGKGATAQLLYDQALQSGSDFIIGPLAKDQVQQLQTSPNLPIATLALNYGNDELVTENLYQFGLAAEDEARQAAAFARKQGYSTSLIIAPDSEWGARIANAFEQEWLANEGLVLETQLFSRDRSYADTIKTLLNVDDSEARSQRVRQVTNRNIESAGRRRTDVDFIFVIATPQQARQIKPTLAFYFAGKLPVVATSHIYGGNQSGDQNRDLDGIIFCETPWMLGYKDTPLRDDINATWPSTSERLGRLYALGVDSYRLLPRVKQMAAMPSTSVSGATGTLAVDEQGRVVRTLRWAEIRNGKVKSL